jgi:hypothetical protein
VFVRFGTTTTAHVRIPTPQKSNPTITGEDIFPSRKPVREEVCFMDNGLRLQFRIEVNEASLDQRIFKT